MNYWAHSDRSGLPPEHPDSKWQPLSEHLSNVADLARSLAVLAAPANIQIHELAEWCGLLHDLGKYTDCFQKMIVEKKGKCQHAIHGAALSFGGPLQGMTARPAHVALAIAGHHAGLPDFSGGGNSLEQRVKKHQQEALSLVDRARRDSPRLQRFFSNPVPLLQRLETERFDLFTRILFSCLVDADRLDSAGRTITQAPLDAPSRLQHLLTHIDQLAGRTPNGVVKTARREVLEDCLSAAASTENLLSLSVPTGGGKTLAAMAFALQRAALRTGEYRRIIVVIPYLSIIEQNAEVYAQIFGGDAILEHHSGSFDRLREREKHFVPEPSPEDDYLDPSRRAETENWDSPLIVTTSVRFFESLFSNRPSDLRRVHNITRSIVILDEVQVLPRVKAHGKRAVLLRRPRA